LLDSLIDLFLESGFLRFSLEELAAKLRCSKSSLYLVAPSKEQLFAAVVREFFRRSTERVEASVLAEPDPVLRISAYLEAISVALAPATSAFYTDVDDFSPAREIYRQNTDVAARRVRDLVAAASLVDDAVDAAFIGSLAAIVIRAIQRGEVAASTTLSDADAYRRLADLIVAPIKRSRFDVAQSDSEGPGGAAS
jgi:AcrR family transcriptional regulator